MDGIKAYFAEITKSAKTLLEGLRLTINHLFDATTSRDPIGIEHEDYFEKEKGIMTLQYPRESIPVPDTGRYRLHNEIDDCIVCDKCAKICPVDCIDIEPIRSPEEFGKTSDGTSKRIYAARFDIDMAKCCFCGLCTTVCPTECLTMTKTYDFSEFDVQDHNYEFAEMTSNQISEKKATWEQHMQAKEKSANEKPTTAKPGAKPVFRPRMMKPKPGKK